MTTIQFAPDSTKVNIANNIKAVADAILATYQPDNVKRNGINVSISHVPLTAAGIHIEARQYNTQAQISIPINNAQAVFGKNDFRIADEFSAIRRSFGVQSKQEKTLAAEYQETAKAYYGSAALALSGITDYQDTTYIRFDISELDMATLSGIEKALRICGLNVKATGGRAVNFN